MTPQQQARLKAAFDEIARATGLNCQITGVDNRCARAFGRLTTNTGFVIADEISLSIDEDRVQVGGMSSLSASDIAAILRGQTGYAPRSSLDLEESQRLAAARKAN